MNELAQGDLKMWLGKKHTNASFLSLWAQIAIAGNGLEKEGFVHHDLHWGNLLYHNVPKDNVYKYLHYKMDGHDVYVKIQKEHWVLWDFGKMQQAILPYETSLRIDVTRISHFAKWAKNKKKFPMIDEKIQRLCNNISNAAHTLKTYFDFLLYLEHQFKTIDDTVLIIDPLEPPSKVIKEALES
jgi:predicted unusual protein kinase regulating ubiquinone biosynthesis (AarF/ABC1/UbiB family)